MAYVNVDRDSASRLGISMADVDNALYNAFGQRLISTIYTQANQYRVVLEHNTEATPKACGAGYHSPDQQRRWHRAVDRHRHDGAALYAALHQPSDQFPVTTISFNVPDNYSLGEAVQAIMDTERR